jgi:phage terminase large subunit
LIVPEIRYLLAEGGRGGGKSHAIARIILYLCEHRKLRVVCGREIQKSIAESVYSLMVDLIRAHELNFQVFSSKIVHKVSGSTIHFRGFREQGAFNIQGMEGVDITWIDEAQALTKQTIDVLIPTIRKDTAKIFLTMNRHVEDDPAYDFCIGRADTLHVHIDYFDNPFCTDALKREAMECKEKSQRDYDHIWLGIPLAQSEDAVFGYEELMATRINKKELVPGYGMRIAGYDVARYGDDKCAVVIIQQMGALHWETIFFDQWDHRDLNYTTGRILMTSSEYKVDKSIIDEDGIGAGPLDTLNKGRGLDSFVGFRNPPISYSNNKEYGNHRTANAYKLKEMVMKGHIAITDDDCVKELTTLKYNYDHYQRKILVSKEVMRSKYQVKSPNLADSLIMAVSLIGDVKAKQEQPYRIPNRQAPECNLFEVAGIR